MKIVFVRTYDFPLGGAPQNRALGICRGLIEQGHKVEVHIFAPGRLDFPLNHEKKQIYKSVPIFNHSWHWAPAKNKVKQIFGILEGFWGTVAALIKSHHEEPFDYLFLNNNKNIYALPFFIMARIFGSRFGRELNEYPQFVLFPHRYTLIGNFIRRTTNYRWFDDFLIMTKTLIEFYRPLAKKNARFMHLPMTVDLDRFPDSVHDLGHAHDITYCGDLSQDKDGVLTLIEAFALLKDEFPSVKLKLLGNSKDKEYMNKLINLLSELDLEEKVVLAGFVHPEDIPDRLIQSRLLVLSRPDSVQARGGFPTKLGEYLATGVPVAVTSVGEIPDYLTDGADAFIAEPGSVESFANAMRRALSDDARALRVGQAGREIAIAHFSHSAQGKLISSFLSDGIVKQGN
jgi:glycosyltransferase involved in cell wall biosynthesis